MTVSVEFEDIMSAVNVLLEALSERYSDATDQDLAPIVRRKVVQFFERLVKMNVIGHVPSFALARSTLTGKLTVGDVVRARELEKRGVLHVLTVFEPN